MANDKLILGIETSCDETSAAVVKNGREAISNVISTQIDIHKIYGGVVPEIASRKHMENIGFVVDEALNRSGAGLDDIDAIAVTSGPGLVGALLVGVSYAKALCLALKKPLIGVNHIEGHICSNYIGTDFEPPFICLVVSGGHTHLVKVSGYGKYDVIGRTVDDAAGEAYDKVARTLGLGYPGGPEIDKLSKLGNPDAILFPRASVAYGFSFSGLKSAVLNYLNKAAMTGIPVNNADVAASFQKAVVEVLVKKAVNGCCELGISKLALAGGVSSNSALRRSISEACIENGIELNMPSPVYCTDNGAMIASCGYYNFINGKFSGLELNANPSLSL